MVAFTKFNSFAKDMAEQVHDFSADSFKVALCAAASPPLVTNGILTDLTQISYTGLSARDLTIASSSQTSGVYKSDFDNLLLTASSTVAAFRYAIIYNDTPSSPLDPLISFADYGADIPLLIGEQLAVNFNAANGFFLLT